MGQYLEKKNRRQVKYGGIGKVIGKVFQAYNDLEKTEQSTFKTLIMS